MKFDAFERFAHEVYEEIPEEYREGVDGLVVRRGAPAHPDLPGVYTMGECLTEEHVSDYGSSVTTRSLIALYWGSFHAIAREREDFDWEEEAWETITHELRHHLESLAGDDALEGVDYAADETFKRFQGDPFDPWYWEHGDEVAPGVYRVERAVYVRRDWRPGALDPEGWIDFSWAGRRWRVRRPEELGDVHFVLVDGLGDSEVESLEVVLVRQRSAWESMKRLMKSAAPLVIESDAVAEPDPTQG